MVSKTVLIVSAAGLAMGVVALGYCVYFDRKRRRDPSFKRKLKEKREVQFSSLNEHPSLKHQQKLPPLDNPDLMQAYFMQEVQLGEELLSVGDIQVGIEHLCNAVVMCNSSDQLLAILKDTLTPELFNMLLVMLPSVREKLHAQIQAQVIARARQSSLTNQPLVEEEVDSE